MNDVTVYYTDFDGNEQFIRFNAYGLLWSDIREMFDSIGLQTRGCSILRSEK